MIDQSLQYYNGDLLGFIPQPKRQERDRTSLTYPTRSGDRTHQAIHSKSK
ncbi:hypothetical protein GNF10_02960 [Nostoc sp. UCD121]|nr:MULTISPECIES: hypothetical protein [unclassified Nostoc]MBC1223491.1 hypothetical protein [Nostoc sp. UCD120]MBC1274961.1 hypothetical protein [Nostoc sp. UCD121]MBC1297409.1 hypothetical protein [Nostoc sp. UCD122]